ncbi:MAG: low molecular weight phosphotyrosine protein phosphatase [Alphaproteobacteria bacterium]|nr:low molecular weight phosphotyrosine protein phosphatase [Alphaproteobacteria bacterium]
MTTKVLFVCTANLCRSPMAEGVFRSLAERAGVADAFEIASAGTSDAFVGRPPTPEAIDVAASRGYDISAIRSRQIVTDDIVRFDYPLAMDSRHLVEMRWLVQGPVRAPGACGQSGHLSPSSPRRFSTLKVSRETSLSYLLWGRLPQ